MKRSVRIGICTALALIGAASILYGALSGQIVSVLTKATHVCLECIGIG